MVRRFFFSLTDKGTDCFFSLLSLEVVDESLESYLVPGHVVLLVEFRPHFTKCS